MGYDDENDNITCQKLGRITTSDFDELVGDENFGNRLRFMREKKGLLQVDLAAKIGSSLSTIQNYESGKLPKGEYLLSLTRVLGCSADWLLTGKDDTTSASDVQTSARPGPGSLTAEYIPAKADGLRPGGPVEGFGQAVEMLSDIFHSRDKVLIDTAISVLTTLSARCGRKPHHYNKEE